MCCLRHAARLGFDGKEQDGGIYVAQTAPEDLGWSHVVFLWWLLSSADAMHGACLAIVGGYVLAHLLHCCITKRHALMCDVANLPQLDQQAVVAYATLVHDSPCAILESARSIYIYKGQSVEIYV